MQHVKCRLGVILDRVEPAASPAMSGAVRSFDTRSGFSTRPCASAFLTSDCEIPNCLAIANGLTPALKAARTAFSLLVVNEPAPSWRRCGFASATGFSFAGSGGRRPRRSASVVTAASSASISTSSNRFSAPARVLRQEMALHTTGFVVALARKRVHDRGHPLLPCSSPMP